MKLEFKPANLVWTGIGIAALYDIYAFKTSKVGTLTSVVHAACDDPVKFGGWLIAYLILGGHLFLEPRVKLIVEKKRVVVEGGLK